MEILIATKNEAKIKKYATMLSVLGIKYKTLKDLKTDIEIEETGNTPKENSIIKAKAYYETFHIPVLADDSGMILDKLPIDKQPGVFVRRHNGKELSDEEIINLYSKEIEEIGGETSGAFEVAITVIDEKGKINTRELKHDRLFVSIPCKERNPGFPMNSLVYDKETNKYLAQVYEGSNIYKGSSFENDLEFIKKVLIDKKE